MAAPRPILAATGLSKAFVAQRSVFGRPLKSVRAVEDVSLTLAPGETLALVGESGCGKSTLGRLLMRLIEPSAGSIVMDGEDVTALSARDLKAFRRKIQLIFQDPFASLNPRMTIGQMVAEPLMLHDVVPPAQRRARVAELLAAVGLGPQHLNRYPHEFSGGQRQRIVIARALAAAPRVIVCDEPVSALDVSIQSQILNLLKDLQAELGIAYVFISHDLGVVKHIADRVAVMYLGRIVETAPVEQLFAQPRHPYTRALLSAIPAPSPALRRPMPLIEGDLPSPIDPPSGCHFHTRCPYAQPVCSTTRPGLDDDGAGHATACHFWPQLPPAGDAVPRAPQRDPRLESLLTAFTRPLPPADEVRT